MADDPNSSNSPNKGEEPKAFDPKSLSDEDLKKVLEDERLWKTERLSQLRESDKKLKEREKADTEAEKKRLESEGKTKELLELTLKERDEAVKRAEQIERDSKIISEAFAKGIKDTDAALKLIDSSKIAKGEDGNYSGITEAVESLIKARPYLTNQSQSVGNPSNPGNGSQNPGTFTISQIQNPEFYQKNRDAIMKAQMEGRISDDRNVNGGSKS